MSVKLFVDSKNTLGESPCWDTNKNLLYWVDIIEKEILKFNPMDRKLQSVKMDQFVGCLSLTDRGRLILGLQQGIYFFNWKSGLLEKVGDPESHLEENRFNDGKCDSAGRFWAGTTDTLGGVNGKGALYALGSHLRTTKKVENVGTSNGLAWSPCNRFMYFIDTPTKQVVQYRYDVTTGHIECPEVVINFPEGAGFPDGMTIDEDGMLWIAHWGGKGISRWNPYNGKQLEFIAVPAVNVTSCAFGGPELNEMYITTARTRMTDEQLNEYPHAGGVYILKTNIRGIENFVFQEKKNEHVTQLTD
ncbi:MULTISPECIES: SMP-30/gluconolactonase/LRE family protein [Rossellomorea]|uniref:SMP-30/gluconolactonase/LRE family protein n=1 Tax=Rossellomorea TaxID=2837508 RepID=UPI001CC947CE|nr:MULTISPECIES: SMP-30/gluconolactonase/LRE family protein [Rossellomorea]MCA0148406.1 SMP-30/gluconolactonase/LRE family protein [Rossellomorea vietnamensis]WGG47782.1 SMP-30/gluconolactonase/LRE family protein [Rossellomorea sp. DA94]